MKICSLLLSIIQFGFTAGEMKHRGGPDIDECRAGNETPDAIMTGVLECVFIKYIVQKYHIYQLGM